MVLDTELVERARAASKHLEEADRQALVSRAEYHTAVRRLHLAGGSLREIAQTLGLSHQRVQQIVSSAGGSWWSRVWRTRQVRPDAVCTWCGRPPSEVSKLIAGPRVYICDACVEKAERAVAGPEPEARPFSQPARARRGGQCAFCGRRGGASRPLVTAPPGHICTACLRVCREILDGRATSL
jgi:ClpX C4-type zinc finger